MQYIYKYRSPIGGITMACDGEHLTGLWFDGQKYFARSLQSEHAEKYLPIFEDTVRWLDIYFSGHDPMFTPKLSVSATVFQKSVLELLLKIPFGCTTSYGCIANELSKFSSGRRISARAVGGAVGRNPISLIIPCHRVIGSDGKLTGYAGGTDKKAWLLGHEGIDIKTLEFDSKRYDICAFN